MSILFKVVGAERLLKCNVDKLAVHLKEIKYCHPFYALLLLLVFFSQVSEGRPRMSDVTTLSGISGLSFDSLFLSPPWFFSLVLLLFLSRNFSVVCSPELLSRKKSAFLIILNLMTIKAFLYGSC